jgi:hypothetical protein
MQHAPHPAVFVPSFFTAAPQKGPRGPAPHRAGDSPAWRLLCQQRAWRKGASARGSADPTNLGATVRLSTPFTPFHYPAPLPRAPRTRCGIAQSTRAPPKTGVPPKSNQREPIYNLRGTHTSPTAAARNNRRHRSISPPNFLETPHQPFPPRYQTIKPPHSSFGSRPQRDAAPGRGTFGDRPRPPHQAPALQGAPGNGVHARPTA